MSGRGQSRVTVVGEHKRVDVSLPSAAPVGEFSARLAELCGQDGIDVLPEAWSLAPAGEPAFPLEATLSEMGVNDGQVLYLRDVATEPGAAAVVEDIDEIVATQTQRLREKRVHAGPVVVGVGLLWLVAAGLLARRPSDGADAATALTVAGLLLLGCAWGLAQRRSVVPAAVRLAIALTSVPCLATAGMLVTQALGYGGYRFEGAIVGANVAAAMALVAAPEALLYAVQVQLVAMLGVGALVRGLGADRTGAAAVTAVASMGMLALTHRTAAAVAAWSERIPEEHGPAAATTTVLVDRTHRLVGVLLAGPVAALSVTLPLLALSGRAFALALSATVCAALLVRSHRASFTLEVVGLGGAAAVGGFCLLLYAVHGARASAMAVLVLAGLAVVGAGLLLSVYGAKTPHPAANPASPTGRRPTPWRRKAEGLGVAASIAMTPLAMGVFGAFGQLIRFGRNLF